MSRKKLLVVLAVIFQIGVVITMVASREWLLATGKPFVFQTAPIDPRDIFRGDYVRLDYLFNTIPLRQLDETIREQGIRKGQKVYLELQTDSSGVTHGGMLRTAPPPGNFLRGYASSYWPYRNFHEQDQEKRRKAVKDAWPLSVRYGIEQYYVEQGSGREMEKLRGQRNDFQVPLLIHVAVSASGEAAIRGYEWSNIAIKTAIAQSPERGADDAHASAVMELTLKNRGDKPLSLPLLADNCSFELVLAPNAPQDALNFASPRNCEGKALQTVTLKPDESYTASFDLNQPHWWVHYNDKVTPMGRLPWQYRYRIRYRGERVEGLNGDIVSSAFHGRGNVD